MTEREIRTAIDFCTEWMTANGGAPMTTSELVPMAIRLRMIEPRALTQKGCAMSLGRKLQHLSEFIPFEAVQLRGHQAARRWVLYRTGDA